MKTIFLDVDGVLNSPYTKDETPMGYRGVEDQYIENLQYLVQETGADIVLSSDWRFEYDRELGHHGRDMIYLMDRLAAFGLNIMDITGGSTTGTAYTGRGSEIVDWLLDHPAPEHKWVVLDDHMFYDFEVPEFKPHLVITYKPERDDGHGGYTKAVWGLTRNRAEKAIWVLENV